MNKTIAEIDRYDALWAIMDEHAIPWEDVSKVLRAAANVAQWNPDHGASCVYSGGGPCDCGLPELRAALEAMGK